MHLFDVEKNILQFYIPMKNIGLSFFIFKFILYWATITFDPHLYTFEEKEYDSLYESCFNVKQIVFR